MTAEERLSMGMFAVQAVDKGAAAWLCTEVAAEVSFCLVLAPLISTLYPCKKVKKATVYGPVPFSCYTMRMNKDQAKIFLCQAFQDYM